MRVISGEFKGRRLKAVPGDNTRPTTDKVKESVFNIIGPYFDGGICLDLYAGSGALGIEAVSRGMDYAFLVDKQQKAIQTIDENIQMTRAPEKFSVKKTTSKKALDQFKKDAVHFDLVFLDPPYKKQHIQEDIEWLSNHQLLSERAVLVCETGKEITLPDLIENAAKVKETIYGTIRVTIYQKKSEEE